MNPVALPPGLDPATASECFRLHLEMTIFSGSYLSADEKERARALPLAMRLEFSEAIRNCCRFPRAVPAGGLSEAMRSLIPWLEPHVVSRLAGAVSFMMR